MTVPTVFVAASSEASKVVDSVHNVLHQTLGKKVDVRPWSGQFQLTRTYIESLERLLDTSDFAVLVLTPDDYTTSREVERLSPRDNVVFELGLFFGRLGRDRCFLIQQRDLDLKLPSDLLGIEPAHFSMPPGQELETALASACARIGDAIDHAITTLPSRPRLSNAEVEAKAAMRKFGDRIAGTWWEQIRLKGEAPALSFLTIELDEAHSSVRLEGKAYGPDGVHVANWRSAAARIEGKTIVYVRECQRLDARTTAWLPGLGEVHFDDSSDIIDRGYGKFWESDESHPEDTVIKLVDLRRTQDEGHSSTMRRASGEERQALVRETLRKW
jgi:hypothetical protein